MSGYLRLMTVTELFQNSAYYADHPLLRALKSRKYLVFSEVTIFTLLLTSTGMKEWDNSKDRSAAIKGEARIACKVGQWSGMFHIIALSPVIGRAIFFSLSKDILQRMVMPPTLQQEEETPFIILRSHSGNLDSQPGSWFEPNHFVPLLSEKANRMQIRVEVIHPQRRVGG